MEWYERIKNRREALSMSQDALAKLVGYTSRSTITKIESGLADIPQSKISAIAQALNVSPAYLMGWTNVIQNTPSFSKDKEAPMTIGTKLHNLRQDRGWSAAEAARRLKLVYTTYRGYEKDEREPGHDVLVKAARLYGVSIDYLLGLSDSQTTQSAIIARTVKIMSRLNDRGQNKVADYADDLDKSGLYAKEALWIRELND